MRKFLTALGIALALVVSVPAFVPALAIQAHALGSAGNAEGAESAGAEAAKGTPTNGGGEADSSLINSALDVVIVSITGLFSWMVSIASVLLDNVVYYTVVTMGAFVNDLNAIGVTWRILRDIGNIALLFGFIAMGLTIILKVEWYGSGYKLLPKLLIAAVTLNFSLFATEAIIDVSNLFATQFYTQINGGEPVKPLPVSGVASFSDDGISNKLMSMFAFQKLYGGGSANYKPGGMLIVGVMSILLYLVTSLVFFSLAFILIARFVVLIFLIIFSPIGFAGLAIPPLENVARQWWSMLVRQTITAPVLLLGLYVALAVITDDQFLRGFDTPATGFAGVGDPNALGAIVSMLLSFIVAMGLLIGVTILAKKLNAVGADKAIKLAGAASFGTTAFAAQHVGGRLARRTAQRIQGTKWGQTTTSGRYAALATARLGKATYDIRSTKALKSLPFGGIDAGQARKDGFVGREKDAIKAHEDYAKGLTATNKQKQEQVVRAQNLVTLTDERNKAKRPRDEAANEVENARKSFDKQKTKANQYKLEQAEKKLQEEEAKYRKAEKNRAEAEEAAKAGQKALKSIAQDTYADSIDRTMWGYGSKPQATSELPYADGTDSRRYWTRRYTSEKAAGNIKSDARKSSEQKAMEKLNKQLEDQDKKKGGDGKEKSKDEGEKK